MAVVTIVALLTISLVASAGAGWGTVALIWWLERR